MEFVSKFWSIETINTRQWATKSGCKFEQHILGETGRRPPKLAKCILSKLTRELPCQLPSGIGEGIGAAWTAAEFFITWRTCSESIRTTTYSYV